MSREPVRAIFFDLDGTLLSFRDKTLPDSARQALLQAHGQGVLLFAATGRHPLSVASVPYLEGIPFAGYVTMNGQYCVCRDQVIHSVPLHREDVARMVRHLGRHPQTLLFQSADAIVMNRPDEAVLAVHKALSLPQPQVREPSWALERDLYQICMYTPDGALPPILEEIRHSTYTRWHQNGLDVIPKEGGKGIGVAKMLARFGLSAGEAAAFGDGENDIHMFQSVGVSVAMGNAPDSVKAAADLVTDDVDSHGIHNALQVLLQTP